MDPDQCADEPPPSKFATQPHSSRAAAIDRFDAELMDAIRRDETPQLVVLLNRYPSIEDHVAREYLALVHDRDEGDLYGPFRRGESLGKGGQATVYRAVDTENPRVVALKIFPANQGIEFEARIERERRITASINDPGVCQLITGGVKEQQYWIAMEFIEGHTLETYFRTWRSPTEVPAEEVTPAQRPPDHPSPGRSSTSALGKAGAEPAPAALIPQLLQLFEEIARTVHRIHRKNVVHRDLKPSNVMIRGDLKQASGTRDVFPTGAPVILDFGVAKSDEDESGLTLVGSFLGTRAYASPEQVAGSSDEVTSATDVYALGVMLFEALSGRLPFESSGEPHHRPPVPNLRSVAPDVSREIASVVEKALAFKPADRYRGADALAADLERVRQGLPPEARSPSIGRRVVLWVKREPRIAALFLVVALLLSGLGFMQKEAAASRAEFERTQLRSDIVTATQKLASATARGDWVAVRNVAGDLEALSLGATAALARVDAALGLLRRDEARAAIEGLEGADPRLLAKKTLLEIDLYRDDFLNPRARSDELAVLAESSYLSEADRRYARTLGATQIIDAVRGLEDVLEVDSRHRLATLTLGPLLILRGRFDDALSLADLAEARSARDPFPFVLRALVAGVRGDRPSLRVATGKLEERGVSTDDRHFLDLVTDGLIAVNELAEAGLKTQQSFANKMKVFAAMGSLVPKATAIQKHIDRTDRPLDFMMRFHPALVEFVRAAVPEPGFANFRNLDVWRAGITSALEIYDDPVLRYARGLILSREVLEPVVKNQQPFDGPRREILGQCLGDLAAATGARGMFDARLPAAVMLAELSRLVLMLRSKHTPEAPVDDLHDHARSATKVVLDAPKRSDFELTSLSNLCFLLRETELLGRVQAAFLAQSQSDPDALLAEARWQVLRGRVTLAEDLAKQVLERHPKHLETQWLLEDIARGTFGK